MPTAPEWMGGLLWSVENIHNITPFKVTDFPSNSYHFQIVSRLTLDFVLTSILPVKILFILSLVRPVHAVTVSLCSYVHHSYGVWKALCLEVTYVSGSSNILYSSYTWTSELWGKGCDEDIYYTDECSKVSHSLKVYSCVSPC